MHCLLVRDMVYNTVWIGEKFCVFSAQKSAALTDEINSLGGFESVNVILRRFNQRRNREMPDNWFKHETYASVEPAAAQCTAAK